MLGLASKKDYKLAAVVGLLFGALALPILENLKPAFWQLGWSSASISVFGFMLFSLIAIWISGLIGLRSPGLWQFARYAAAGALAAFLDLGILNLFSLIFQIFSGPTIILFNIASFSAAVATSYLMNKSWAFHKDGESPNVGEFSKFLGVTLIGLVINTTIVYILTTAVGAPAGMTESVWENIAKFCAIVPNVAWNFVGYKFLIFRSKPLI